MALYNNGFPATYQPYYAPVQVQQPQQQNTSSLNWIQGEQAAKSYLVAPNSTVVLFDSESQTIYIKSADPSGMPSMKILDYTIRDQAKNTPNSLSSNQDDKLSVYATKDEIKAVSDQITALKEKVNKLSKRSEDDE